MSGNSTYTVTLRVPEINGAAERAFKETAFLLGRQFTQVITEPRTWDGFNGVRDIVDTGQLRSSQQLVFTQPLEAVFSWPVEYASAVHDGYTLRGGREVKGRPWTTIALQEFDVQATFGALYARELSKL